MRQQPVSTRQTRIRHAAWLVACIALLFAGPITAQPFDQHEGGVLEPVSTELNRRAGMADPVVRLPNTDQSANGRDQSSVYGDLVYEDAVGATSLLGHQIVQANSPNFDMFLALQQMITSANGFDDAGMKAAAQDLMDILLGTTEGRIYDGFSMLNYNRWKDNRLGADDFPPDAVPGEYKMKVLTDTGETFTSPFDGATRKIWEADVSMLYYDGNIDSDTFLLRFPVDMHAEDTVRINYRIYSMVREDFSPTLVMVDRREALNTVQFPFKGFDAVWIAFNPKQVLNVSINYPPARNLRGVYTWGWRVHPPRIQFMQPVYEIVNAHTQEVELDPQSYSYAYRNREDLTLEAIGRAAPEMKMYELASAVLNDSIDALDVQKWMTRGNEGPRGTWPEWADLAEFQRQIPAEAWDLLADEGITPGNYGDYNMISVFLNNEMYGEGPDLDQIGGWSQGDVFKVKLINLDRHTHYFRNVDFGTRLHDDILHCCGGGATSFEVMNFKPSYGAPKVAEMQWRAGWGFRPHYDVIQQDGVFSRASDRLKIKPYRSGEDLTYYGYQYSEENRGGDFRFNPPPFVIGFDAADPSPYLLRDFDGENGLVIGQFTQGYGTGQMCPDDPYPGFCSKDIAAFNPFGSLNWPPPPLQGVNGNPDQPTELRFPPFLRNPSQGVEGAGDIIPPTGAWDPFIYISPNNGTLWIDDTDPSKGFWSDLTMAHGAPVFEGQTRSAIIELPRASGQVFYQFDDLFHDNSIFSPHPLFEGGDEMDEVEHLNAFVRNYLRIRGRLGANSAGEYAEWVSLFGGPAGDSGCTGPVLSSAPVDTDNGAFYFRCGLTDRCSAPVLRSMTTTRNHFDGFTICVQSTVGAFREFTVVDR